MSRSTKRLIRSISLIGGFLLLAFALYMVIQAVMSRAFIKLNSVPCVYQVIDDANGDGHYDSGEQQLTLPDLVIEVNDPQGPNSGRYSADSCFITPESISRTVHLHLIMPAGYKATSPTDLDLTALSSDHFQDYPPQTTLFVQSLTVSKAGTATRVGP